MVHDPYGRTRTIYWNDGHFWMAAFSIIFIPLYWMLVAFLESRYCSLQRIFCSRHVAVLVFACSVFSLSCYRNWRFMLCLNHQPKWELLQDNVILWMGHTLAIVGFILVLTSHLVLGFFAVFMGDYFGIHLPRRVTRFPYNWLNHPMYTGGFMVFLGMAIVNASLAGLLLALLAGVMYAIAAMWEELFTNQVYVRYPWGVRSVAVQVGCITTLVEIAARTVGTQTKGEVVVEQTEYLHTDVETFETPEDPNAKKED